MLSAPIQKPNSAIFRWMCVGKMVLQQMGGLISCIKTYLDNPSVIYELAIGSSLPGDYNCIVNLFKIKLQLYTKLAPI